MIQGPMILLVAIAVLAAIWAIVLVASPLFGSNK
jgi:hypothetical protein